MIRVGLVGEDPNDTSSVKALLQKKYPKGITFCQILKGVKGDQLESEKLKRALVIEWSEQNCKFLVYVRDLDGLPSEKEKIRARKAWFDRLNKLTGSNNLLLLNVWELEALILGDIETFNKEYKTTHKQTGDPQMVKEPKEVLKRITFNCKKQFKESHCPDIFSKLDVMKVEEKCKIFRHFLKEFDTKLNA